VDPMGQDEEPDFSGFDDYDDGEIQEIDESERRALHQDLLDVRVLKKVLGARGIRGIVSWCPDCESDHFVGWELLAGNLEQIIQSGRPPVHEPAWEPDPDEYVSWDYARGFLDGVEARPGEPSGLSCAFCGSDLPPGGYDWSFCPSCGKELAVVSLIQRLAAKGWSSEQIETLLDECGFDVPLLDEDDVRKLSEIKDPPANSDG
jgi:hypothetical protein